jgi:hypothetical protein
LTEVLTLWFRYGEEIGNTLGIDRKWLDLRLKQVGIDTKVFEETLEANRAVPTLQDVIGFAIRDVYEEESANQAQLFSGLPERYLTEAKKRGLSEEDAKLYWGAHWNLPSLTQVYEMFHRLYPGSGYTTSFTEKDMDTFFNLADIAPGYRDKLKDISYNPLTRVDIRRIYQMGLWGSGASAKARLIREYRQIGYDPLNAGILADFTIQSYGEGRKKFTASQIRKFYLNKTWGEENREKAILEFRTLGYDESQATALLNFIDLEEITKEEQIKIDAIKEQWLNGSIESEAELHTTLMKVPVSQEKAVKLLKEFETERTKRQSRLTRSEIDRLYKNSIITELQYREFLKNLGYIEKDIDLLVKSLGVNRVIADTLPVKDDIIAWYGMNTIGEVQYITYMRLLGYRDEFIDLYAEGVDRSLSEDVKEEMDLPKDDAYEILSR